MKLLRDGICYVDIEDLFNKDCESIHFESKTYNKGDMAIVTDPKDIETIMGLDFIIDYDEVFNIDDYELMVRINREENDLAYFSDILSSTPIEERQELWDDEDFSKGYGRCTYRLKTLREYYQNRDDYDLKVANHLLQVRVKKKGTINGQK
jgi:uncharacterized protein YjbK